MSGSGVSSLPGLLGLGLGLGLLGLGLGLGLSGLCLDLSGPVWLPHGPCVLAHKDRCVGVGLGAVGSWKSRRHCRQDHTPKIAIPRCGGEELAEKGLQSISMVAPS